MAKPVAQLAHDWSCDVSKVGIGRKPRQKPGLRSDGIARGDGILHNVAALNQREQMAVHGAFGDLQAFRQLGDAELLAGKRDCLQHVEGEPHGSHSGIGTVIRHSPWSRRYVCSRKTTYQKSHGNASAMNSYSTLFCTRIAP